MLAFWFVCVPVRFLLVWLVLHHASRIWSLLALLVSIGFLLKVFQDPKFGFFGGRVWWAELRKVHVVLWFLAAACIFEGFNSNASLILFLDVLMGTTCCLYASTIKV